MKGLDDKDVLDSITERIFQFIEAEGLSYADFAASIDIGAAVVSHMKNGRNKVSLNVCAKILDSFPKLNPDWLLLGVGVMYRNSPGPSSVVQPNLFTKSGQERELPKAKQTFPAQFEAASGSKQLKKVVLFYDDNSFQELIP